MKVLRVHLVDAHDPCHLIEVEFDTDNDIDWESITQPSEGDPALDWQVPWDEQRVIGHENRWAFFFHFLDLTQPLQSKDGPVDLPGITPLPSHLSYITYEKP